MSGVYLNELTPSAAGGLAAALGVYLSRHRPQGDELPVVVVGGDRRAHTPELLAAVSDGLRWAGCHVVDIGPTTAPCAAFTIAGLKCAGGVLVGGRGVHTMGLKFWGHAASPFSAGGPLEEIQAIQATGPDRPSRRYGGFRRYQADTAYLAALADQFHAMRPLRFVLDAKSGPWLTYLERLIGNTACRAIPCQGAADRMPDPVRSHDADFGLHVDDDGERCRILDEQGRRVDGHRLLVLLAGHILCEQPGQAVVLEQGARPEVARGVAALGARVVPGGPRRAEMHGAMRRHAAILGYGGGRFWYRVDEECYLADALRTVTLLLRILSQSDRRLSEALDAAAPPD